MYLPKSKSKSNRIKEDHNASHLFYAPVARPYGLAGREPSPAVVDYKDQQMARERWFGYVDTYMLGLRPGQTNSDRRAGHAFRKNTAGAFGPDLARKLSQLVKMEKNVMRSMELVARERMETAVCTVHQGLG